MYCMVVETIIDGFGRIVILLPFKCRFVKQLMPDSWLVETTNTGTRQANWHIWFRVLLLEQGICQLSAWDVH